MAESLGIGIIGTGTIAQAHLRALQETPRGRAVVVFDALQVTRVIDAAYRSVRERTVLGLA